MRKYICLSAFIFLTAVGFSQKILPEFGTVDITELQLRSCPFQPEAVAMNLFDATESEITYDQYSSTLKTERRIRIKIFKEAGYDYATVKIPYPRKNSAYKIDDVKAIVYNLDETGKVVSERLERRDFLKNKADEYTGVINFTFPHLKPGSVVEYSYIRTEYDNFHLDTWIAQDVIPTQYTVNAIVVPGESGLKEKYFGVDTITRRQQLLNENRERFIYYKENVSSFVGEPYMTSSHDNLLRVSYFLLPKANRIMNVLTQSNLLWGIAGRQLLASSFVMGQIATNIPGTDSLLKAAKKISSVYDRIQFLFRAVKTHGQNRGEQTFLPINILEAWKNKGGSTAELNLILINLLRRAEVPCFPLLVSTRSHGNIRTDFPSFSQFNGMDVVAVDSSKVYVLDAGFKSQTIDVPPPNVLNRIGLLLNGDRLTWMQIADSRPLFKQESYIQAALNTEGDLVGNATKISYDYAKMALLDSSIDESNERDGNRWGGLKIHDYKFVSPGLDSDPVKEQMLFEWPSQKTGDFYFVKPQFLSSLTKNPFTKDTRTTDIDFGSNQELTTSISIDLARAYDVEFLPRNAFVQSPDSSLTFRRTCTQTDTSVTLSQTFEIKRCQIGKEAYPAIQDFFKKLYGLLSEEMIFKRKK